MDFNDPGRFLHDAHQNGRDSEEFIEGLNEDFDNWKSQGHNPADWWP